MIKTKLLLLISLVILPAFALASPALASSLYLSPGSGQVSLGAVKPVQIRLNTGGEAVNGISAFLSYPADKLEVAWINYGSSFAIAAEGWGSGGTIKISRGNITGVAGDVNVATVGFKGKAPGSATVAFTPGSAAPRAADSSDSLNLGASRGGAFDVVAAPAAPPAAGPTPTPAPRLPKITNINVSQVATDSATVAWQTDLATDSTLEYGLDKGRYALTVSNQNLARDHRLAIAGPLLVPGLKLHFRVKVTRNTDQVITSEDTTIQLLGYTARMTLTTTAGQPISQASVTTYNSLSEEPLTGLTDSQGRLTFTNLTAGQHPLVVRLPDRPGWEKAGRIVVAEGRPGLPQQFTIKLDLPAKGQTTAPFFPTNPNLLKVIIPALAVTTLAAVALIIYRKRRQRQDQTPYPPDPPPELPLQ